MAGTPAFRAIGPNEDNDMQWTEPQRGFDATAALRKSTKRQRADHLARIVEGEIIPRLMRVHKPAGDLFDAPHDVIFSAEDVRLLADLALYASQDDIDARFADYLRVGAPVDALYLDLVAPAARLLNTYWSDDVASFVDVTIALGRLQQAVRDLSLYGLHAIGPAHLGRSALFACAPGEQHTFGLVLVEDFFRRAGWRTQMSLEGGADALIGDARSASFDVFGVTASCDALADRIEPMIAAVRRASLNKDIRVFVGGRLFEERPELVGAVGADGTAADAREAVLIADGAVMRQASR